MIAINKHPLELHLESTILTVSSNIKKVFKIKILLQILRLSDSLEFSKCFNFIYYQVKKSNQRATSPSKVNKTAFCENFQRPLLGAPVGRFNVPMRC